MVPVDVQIPRLIHEQTMQSPGKDDHRTYFSRLACEPLIPLVCAAIRVEYAGFHL